MLVIESTVDVAGLTGRDVTDFMGSCTDERYRSWWQGTHLQLHVLGRTTGGVGDVVVMEHRPCAGPAAAAVPHAADLDAHVRTEFPLLRDYLRA